MAEELTYTSGPDKVAVAATSAPPASPPGYELLDEIGHGGMGVVYRARDVALDRDVAVKLLAERYQADSPAAQRFLSEARITGQLQHPGIPAVHQVGTLADGRPFLAMKLIKGGTLEVILKQRSDPSAERGRLLAIFEAVCQAVGYAHAHRVIHRDLKPANVMVGAFGEVQVMDWGLAKVLGDAMPATADALAAEQTQAWTQVSPTPESGSYTQAGSLLGTPAFIPPEQAAGEIERVNKRADVFGLGALLAVILTGKPPYVGGSFEAVRVQAVRGKLEDCFARLDACGAEPELVALCKKCLAFEPADRPADAGAVAAAVAGLRAAADERARQAELERVQAEGETREALARAAEQRRRRRILLAASGIIALVFLAGFAGVLWQWRAAETAREDTDKALKVVESEEEAGRKLQYTTDMQLAPFLWKDDRTTAEQLRVLLARHIPESNAAAPKPDLRGFEWHYYRHLLEDSAAVFSGHDVPVVVGAFTADGQLVTLDENGQVRRWELGSRAEEEASRRDLPGGPGAQAGVLSPDGRLAALAEGDKVHVFDTSTGKETFQIDSAKDPYRRLIFSPDSARLVIVDDQIRWLSAVSGEVIAAVHQKFGGETDIPSTRNLALSADGLTLAVVGHGFHDTKFSIFRLDETAKKVTPLARDAGFNGMLPGSALSPDGQRIALGHIVSGDLHVFDTTTGRSIAGHMSAHASSISALAFSSDGARLATGDGEGLIKIWQDAQKLSSKSAALMTLKGHQGAITAVRFSTDGKRLVTTSVDKTARVWDLENTGAAIRRLEGASQGWSFVARFSSDGDWVAVANGNSVRLWDAATGRLARELSAGDNNSIFSVAFSPAADRLLAVGYGNTVDVSYVALWDIDAGTELVRLPGATDLPDFPADKDSRAVGSLAFSPDGKYLAASFGVKWLVVPGSPSPLKVWEVADRRLIRLDGHTGVGVSLDFSRDGKLLASGSRDGTAILWSTATWKRVQTLRNPDKESRSVPSGRGMVEGVAFSPDGNTLAMASFGGSVHLWDVASGKLLETLKGHSSSAWALVFSPDGRTLVSGGADYTVRLWNVQTRRQLMQLDPGSIELRDVLTLAFSPDGKQLLAGGVGGCAFWSAAPIVWNDPDRAAEKLRLLLQSNADFQSRIRMLFMHTRLYEALKKLDKLVPNDGRVHTALAAALARRLAAQGDAALADAAGTKARTLLEEKLAKEPNNPARAVELADVLLTMALADHRRGETDEAKKVCRQAAELLKRAGGADLAVRPSLRQAVLSLRIESPEAKELIAAAAGEPPAALNAAVRQKPDQAQVYRDRGNWHAERGRWKEAIADYAEVFRLDPNTLDGMRLAFLLAQTGEKDCYRKHGKAMLSRWAATENNAEADQTLKANILLPDYKGDGKQLARLAEVAVAGDDKQALFEWFLFAKGLHEYRTGKYADAVATCRASRQRAATTSYGQEVLTCLDLVVEAMASQGAGHADEARRTLGQAKPLFESHVPGIDGGDGWWDWLPAHMLYREAVGLIAAKPAVGGGR